MSYHSRQGVLEHVDQQRFDDLPETDAGWVYIIECVGTDAFKIGWARDPLKRKRLLQSGSPFELRLIAVMEGTRRDETALHQALWSARCQGGGREWFLRTNRTLEVIPRISPDAVVIPMPHLPGADCLDNHPAYAVEGYLEAK